MSTYSLSHVSDGNLARDLAAAAARDRASTAVLLAHIAEFDARKLFLPAAHPSMHSYCTMELHLSNDAAYKRIQAARAARQFPAIFEAVADGRLHLAAACLLAPYLTAESANELIAAATHRSKAEVERLLADRCPQAELPQRVEAIPVPHLCPGRAASRDTIDRQLALGQVDAPAQRPKLTPLAPERYGIQFTADQETHDLLRQAQALLGHQLPTGDLAQVFKRALTLLVHVLERRKFAATARPRRAPQPMSANPRHIPAAVKRAVRERDQDRCSSRARAARAARLARGSSLITSSRWRPGVRRRWTGCGFGAGLTTSSRLSARSAPASWRASEKKRNRPQRPPSASGLPTK